MIDLSEISARIISTKDVYLCNEQWQGTKTRLVINDSILLSSFCIYANDYFSNMPAHLIGTAIAQAPVVQRVDNAIHRINHYPVDKCWENKLDYPPDSDLSGG